MLQQLEVFACGASGHRSAKNSCSSWHLGPIGPMQEFTITRTSPALHIRTESRIPCSFTEVFSLWLLNFALLYYVPNFFGNLYRRS